MPASLLLGHRGARSTRSIPENTIASFDLALEHGCDGFEFDVRLTADGQPVICHDPEIAGIEIASARAEQVSQLPSLQQVVARYQATAFLDIELKVSGLEQIVLEVLGEHPPQKGFVVSSFLPEPLVALRSLDAELPVGLICETTPQYREWHNLPVQFVIPHHTLIDINIIQELHEAGRRVLAWTVNLEERMLQLRDRGVDGIISDRTDLLGKLRE